MKIAIVVKSDDKQREIHRVSLLNKTEYAQRWGYHLIDDITIPDDRSPVWMKIPAIIRALYNDQQFDWVFWSDADSLIMKMNIPLESFLAPAHYIIASCILGTYDDKRQMEWIIHTGNIIIRNNIFTKEFFNQVYEYPDFKDDIKGAEESTITALYQAHSEIRSVFGRKNTRTLLTVMPDTPYEGVIPTYQPGDFIIHFPGSSNQVKLKMMKAYNGMVIR